MEMKFIISGVPERDTDRTTTTIHIDAGALAPTITKRGEAAAGQSPGGVAQATSETLPLGTDETQDSNALPAGQAMLGPGDPEAKAMQSAVLIQPPAEVLRAAAAIGAANAGPAPMLTGSATGMTPGEPQQFLATGAEAAMMTAIGSPDQPAGAAPESKRMRPGQWFNDNYPKEKQNGHI